jgi:hypothetical protein
MDAAEQSATMAMIATRRLRFPAHGTQQQGMRIVLATARAATAHER